MCSAPDRECGFMIALRGNLPRRFVNGGKGGAPSSYIHQCVYKFAPKNEDLVLVEFALNDKQPDCGVNTPVR